MIHFTFLKVTLATLYTVDQKEAYTSQVRGRVLDPGSDGGDKEQWTDLREYFTSLVLMSWIRGEDCEGNERVRSRGLKNWRDDVCR